MEQQANENRMVHYDLLRILAACSVVMLHASALFWYDVPVTDPRWLVANTYNALSRFGVPVFVMISGALFLSPSHNADGKKLYTHNILRLAVLYLVWSCIYGLLDCFKWGFSSLSASDILHELLYGRYHLWYLPMLIGIYMLLPILKIWVAHADRKNIEYFLLLFLLFQIGRETLAALSIRDETIYIISLLKPYMVCGYLGYFLLGYYLDHYGIRSAYHKWIYLAAIPSAVCNIYLSFRLSAWKGEPLATIDDSFGIFTFLIATALFLFFREKVSRVRFPAKTRKRILEFSRATLGVYVMHICLLEQLQYRGICGTPLPNIIFIPLLAVFCYAVCTLAAAILRRIPVVGKYIC